MNVLWNSFDSWVSLLKLVPTLSLVSEENLYTTAGVVLEKHLERLNFYTRRIRRLKLGRFDQNVSTHLYDAVSYSQHKLFPSLRTLMIPALGELYRDNLNTLLLTLSSSLSSVRIGGIMSSREVYAASFLHRIPSEARFLVHLHLSGCLSSVTLDLIDNFNLLETLQLDLESTTFDINMLDSLPNLKHFALTLDENSSFNYSSRSTTNPLSLQSLEITGPAAHLFAIIQNVFMTNLTRIKISLTSFAEDMRASLARESFEKFIEHHAASSLQSIQVDKPRGARMSWKVLTPLSACNQLKHLKISIDYLNSARLLRLCQNGEWRTLETLFLACDRVKPGETGLTIYDLCVFGHHCPELRVLALSLECITGRGEIETMRGKETDPKFWLRHRLEKLQLLSLTSCPDDLAQEAATKSTKDAVAVSQYIHSLFPHLDELVYPSSVPHDWFDGVEDMLKVYRNIRENVVKHHAL
ncbi:hypothetical protein GALMADRAFT_241266 [Galerina marginata CBS 339.88]|uniref:F-box domain-containing protein n=1 Tax=Galerina marginata (strain CBS 339.88) TaxID=685588 RepID=A0A067TC62_GALM3|nr:hypothetical protein GALMADRAFT_241266 [Galerina marginata CBS 339.88]